MTSIRNKHIARPKTFGMTKQSLLFFIHLPRLVTDSAHYFFREIATGFAFAMTAIDSDARHKTFLLYINTYQESRRVKYCAGRIRDY